MPPMLRVSSLMVLLTLLAQAGAAGQQPRALSPGMRVRVEVEAVPSVQGTVVSVGSTTFEFQPEKGGDTITVDYSRVQHLDVSRGFHHRVLRDAVLGAFAGMAIGGIVGATSHDNFPSAVVVIPPEDPGDGSGGCSVLDPHCTEPDPNPGQPVVRYREPTGADALRTAKGAGIGTIAGALVGALVGCLTRSEVWRRIPSEHYRIHVATLPLRERGLSVGLSMAMR